MSDPSPALPKILVSTRFSFFGNSGWKSDASRDPDQLFDADRLAQRLWLFDNLTLPSLTGQNDRDFHHFILSSQLMPDWAKADLSEICAKHLGADNHTLKFARPARARKHQRFMIQNLAGDAPVAQVVLDDDDALANDYVADLKEKLQDIQAERGFSLENLPYFVTYPKGYALGLNGNPPQFWSQNYPFINLGLCCIGAESQKNLFGIAHKRAPKRLGFRRDDSKRMFIRTLHEVNDSHVVVRDKWKPIDDPSADPDIQARFPSLLQADLSEYAEMCAAQGQKKAG